MVVTELQILRFPPEVIGDVVAFLSPLEILRLFMCGNKHLMYALGPAGGLRTLNIGAAPWMDMPWLSVISHFLRLRHFSIALQPNGLNYIMLNMDLHMVSRELRTLSLNFFNVFNLLQSPPSSLRTRIAASDLPNTKYFDIGSQFPLLETLALTGSTRFSANVFDVLPAQLRSFSIRGPAYEDITPDIINRLPRSLTYFSLIDDDDGPTSPYTKPIDVAFPPELLTLDLHTKWMQKIVPFLPSLLTTLALRWAYLSIPELLSLPTTLTSLTIAILRFGTPEAQALPRSLKYLVASGQRPLTPPPEYFAALPRGLLDYHALVSELPVSTFAHLPPLTSQIEDLGTLRDAKDLTQLPSRITTFVCKYPLTNEHIAALPRTVTSLRSVFSGSSYIQAQSWPPKLNTIFDTQPSMGTSASPLLDGPLPESIHTLTLSWAGAVANDRARFLAKLPNLTALTMRFSLVEISRNAVLMAQQHGDEAKAQKDAAWDGYPPTDPEFIQAFKGVIASIPPASQILPTSLKSISCLALPPAWCTDLRHLTNLTSLEQSETRFNHDALLLGLEVTPPLLRSLPDSLTTLNMSTSASTFDLACVKSLPPFLRLLHIRTLSTFTTPLKDEDMKHMPRTIFSIILPHSPRITSRVFDYLPSFTIGFAHGNTSMREMPRDRQNDIRSGLFGEEEEEA